MALSDYITLSPQSSIGGIEIQASLEEVHTDTLQITEHPVERGAAITDHSFKRPAEVVLRCGWSNSSTSALLGAASALFDGGSLAGSSYVDNVYSQLLALQESRTPFDIVTNRRKYSNMLIVGLQLTTDNRTSNSLMVTVACRQIIIVSTQVTSLPPKDSQANPASTAEVENAGVKQLQTGAMPSPGGSAPPDLWSNEVRR